MPAPLRTGWCRRRSLEPRRWVIAPARFAVIRVVGVEIEAGAANRQDVGREGGIFGIGRSKVARAGDEGHALMAGRGGKVAVVQRFVAGKDGLTFGETPAHRYHRHAGLLGGGDHAGHQVGQRLAVGFDENDLGPGSHGMHPFHVERGLGLPIGGRRAHSDPLPAGGRFGRSDSAPSGTPTPARTAGRGWGRSPSPRTDCRRCPATGRWPGPRKRRRRQSSPPCRPRRAC